MRQMGLSILTVNFLKLLCQEGVRLMWPWGNEREKKRWRQAEEEEGNQAKRKVMYFSQ